MIRTLVGITLLLAQLLFLGTPSSVAAAEASPAAENPELEARVARVAEELRCLVCQNQTIADSNADLAKDLRREVRQMLTQGKSEQEVREFMVARYGDFILYRPPLRTSTLLLWIGPFALLLVAIWIHRRIVRARGATPTSASLSDEEQQRLQALLGADSSCEARVSTFWIAAGALTLLVVAALAAPMLARNRQASRIGQDAANVELYRDQLAELERDRAQDVLSAEQFEQARMELGQRLLADIPPHPEAQSPSAPHAAGGVWRFVALAAVPVVAVLTYLVLGVPGALEGKLPTQDASGGHAQTLAQLVDRLAARLEKNPQDAEAWVLLARSKHMLGQPADAVKALVKAIELEPRSAPIWADLADVLAASANGEWTQPAKDALAKSLSLDPQHPKALWLAGSEAFVRRDYGTALKHWEKLAPLTEPGSEAARMIQDNIAEARTLLAGAKQPELPQSSAVAAPATADGASGKDQSLKGVVTLDAKIAARVQPNDTVFVFARAAQGPKMPLAVRRITVKDLPYAFALDDSAAMAPGMVISAFDQVVVGARVSRSGDAAPKPGDFEGLSAPIKPGTSGIQVTINAEIR